MLVPKEFIHKDGRLTGMLFEKVKAEYDARGRRRLVPTGEPDQHFECDDVLVAVGQENAFPWIERDIGLDFDQWDMPVVDEVTMGSTHPKVFFGGDAAFGPKNIIWAVAHGHQAAISIHKFCQGEDVNDDNDVEHHGNRGPGSPNSGPGNADDRGEQQAPEVDNSGPGSQSSGSEDSGHSGPG